MLMMISVRYILLCMLIMRAFFKVRGARIFLHEEYAPGVDYVQNMNYLRNKNKFALKFASVGFMPGADYSPKNMVLSERNELQLLERTSGLRYMLRSLEVDKTAERRGRQRRYARLRERALFHSFISLQVYVEHRTFRHSRFILF